jgi:hypothetical protein
MATGWSISTYWQGAWTEPEERLRPGEGMLVRLRQDDVFLLGLAGDVTRGEVRQSLPAGWSLQAPRIPLSGQLDLELGCPVTNLEVVARIDPLPVIMDVFVFADDRWQGAPPMIQAGEAFWIYKHAPSEWVSRYDPPQ